MCVHVFVCFVLVQEHLFIYSFLFFFRKGYILIHRGALDCDANGEQTVYNPDKTVRGRTADRVFPSGEIGITHLLRATPVHVVLYPSGLKNVVFLISKL